MSSDTLYERVPLEDFEKIKFLVEQLYELPGSLSRNRIGANYAWAAVSAGKPWFDYVESPQELLRVRAVERWRVDEKTRDLKAGVIKLSIQQIFTDMGRNEVIEMDDSNTNEFDFHEAVSRGSSNNVVLDSNSNAMKADVGVHKKLKLGRFASGTALASTIKLIAPTNIVVEPEHDRDIEGILNRFFYQEPVFELDVTNVKPSSESLGQVASKLSAFIAAEQLLSLQRA